MNLPPAPKLPEVHFLDAGAQEFERWTGFETRMGPGAELHLAVSVLPQLTSALSTSVPPLLSPSIERVHLHCVHATEHEAQVLRSRVVRWMRRAGSQTGDVEIHMEPAGGYWLCIPDVFIACSPANPGLQLYRWGEEWGVRWRGWALGPAGMAVLRDMDTLRESEGTGGPDDPSPRRSSSSVDLQQQQQQQQRPEVSLIVVDRRVVATSPLRQDAACASGLDVVLNNCMPYLAGSSDYVAGHCWSSELVRSLPVLRRAPGKWVPGRQPYGSLARWVRESEEEGDPEGLLARLVQCRGVDGVVKQAAGVLGLPVPESAEALLQVWAAGYKPETYSVMQWGVFSVLVEAAVRQSRAPDTEGLEEALLVEPAEMVHELCDVVKSGDEIASSPHHLLLLAAFCLLCSASGEADDEFIDRVGPIVGSEVLDELLEAAAVWAPQQVGSDPLNVSPLVELLQDLGSGGGIEAQLETSEKGLSRWISGGFSRFGLGGKGKPKVLDQKDVVLFVVGGLTGEEIRELRAEAESRDFNLFLGTTELCSADSILGQIFVTE